MSPIRLTGMASGLDVDTLVKQMMTAEKTKVDRLTQNRQVVQWKQDLYRELIGELNNFKNTYFDVLKPDSYMLSAKTYTGFDISSSDPTNSVATAIPSTSATAGVYTISDVTMATKATYTGSRIVNVENSHTAYSSLTITDANKTLSFSVTTTSGGTTTTTDYTADLALGTYASTADLQTAIKTAMTNAKDKNSTIVDINNTIDVASGADGKITFSSKDAVNTTISTTGNNTVNNVMKFGEVITAGVNDNLTLKIGTKSYSVTLEASTTGYDNPAALAAKINTALSSAVDVSNGSVLDISGKVSAQLSSDKNRIQLSSSVIDSVRLSGTALGSIGFSGSSVDINQGTGDSMLNILSGLTDAQLKNMTFNINNSTTPIVYDFSTTGAQKNWTISQVLNDIKARANVDISYNQLTRNFSISSKETGSTQNLTVASTAGTNGELFLGALFGAAPVNKPGEDATATIKEPNSDPVTVTKSSNNFTINGVAYSLVGNTAGSVNLTVSSNVQKSFDKIKSFVDKYNEIIDKINTKLFEKKQYDYKPLTEEQKKDMSEDDVKKWEEKAKQGLLANDSVLSNVLYKMRSAFYDSVKTTFDSTSSIGISLSDIGIKTSSDVGERGKLTIDETKLKDALQNNVDKVMELFTKTSTTVPSYSASLTTTDRDKRYKEEGLLQRISDILQDNLRTLRDSNGKKGILLEKAGLKGDISEFKNIITEDLTRRDKIIKEMTLKLADKENRYYLQFSKLETAMQKMNSQSSWLSQQLGAGM